MAKSSKSFESKMEMLEEIVTKLERGEAPLEECMSMYEKGVALAKECMTMLDEAEQKIKTVGAAGQAAADE
ncbi:MAG: exodeoxyribonuclease VII small subunit [Clostridia bacterium]|nr:exodeoxyribonuclease VII small subunit [Clostridia bacterium]